MVRLGPSESETPILFFRRLTLAVLASSAAVALAPATAFATPTPASESAVSALDPGDAQVADSDDPGSLRFRAMLLGGVHGIGGDDRHPYGGVEIGGFRGRFGVLAIGQYGDGAGFRSTLAAGGPAVDIIDFGFASLAAYGGIAWYEEEIEAGFVRDLTGAYGGLSIRIPVRFGAFGATVSLWRGSLDAEGFDAAATVTTHRISLGFGL